MAQCSECGFQHPPMAKGMCPVANAQKMKLGITEKGQQECMETALRVQRLYWDKYHSLKSDQEKRDFCMKISNVIGS